MPEYLTLIILAVLFLMILAAALCEVGRKGEDEENENGSKEKS